MRALTEAAAGHTTRPLRHCEDLRPERYTKEEREPESPPAGLKDRCGQLESADSRHDAAGDGEHGKCGQGHGLGDEEHGS